MKVLGSSVEQHTSKVSCAICKAVLKTVDDMLTSPKIIGEIEAFANNICNKFMYDNSTVCEGAISENGLVVFSSITGSILEPEFFCSYTLGVCPTHYTKIYAEDFVDNLLTTKPEDLKNNNFIDKIYQEIKD